jgi:hypothetical protein
MTESDCYRLELAPVPPVVPGGWPLLPRVECAVVLTMHGSERLPRLQRADCPLHRLCARTLLQINRGYRACPKPQVTNTAYDLTHAYAEVARWTRGMGNVLILEDDAQFMPGATDADFALVDEFVATREFDVYSLGSIGPFRPAGWGSRHRTFVNHWGLAQAIIWSPRAREELLRRAAHRLPMHIDLGFLAQLPRCFTLDRPLVVQTFPVTTNSANWCFMCTSGLVGRVDRGVARLYHAGLGRLGLERSVHGWRTLYVCNSAVLPVLIVMCLAVIAALLSTLRRRLACTFQCGPPAISTKMKSADPTGPWPRPPSAAVRRPNP